MTAALKGKKLDAAIEQLFYKHAMRKNPSRYGGALCARCGHPQGAHFLRTHPDKLGPASTVACEDCDCPSFLLNKKVSENPARGPVGLDLGRILIKYAATVIPDWKSWYDVRAMPYFTSDNHWILTGVHAKREARSAIMDRKGFTYYFEWDGKAFHLISEPGKGFKKNPVSLRAVTRGLNETDSSFAERAARIASGFGANKVDFGNGPISNVTPASAKGSKRAVW